MQLLISVRNAAEARPRCGANPSSRLMIARNTFACFSFSLSVKRWLRIVEVLPPTLAAICASLYPPANNSNSVRWVSVKPVLALMKGVR